MVEKLIVATLIPNEGSNFEFIIKFWNCERGRQNSLCPGELSNLQKSLKKASICCCRKMNVSTKSLIRNFLTKWK